MDQKKELYVICDNIRSLENIGSIFRTSDALGVKKIYLCGISGKPPHPKISKTALGAETVVPFEHHRHAWRVVEKLRKEGVTLLALEQGKKAIEYRSFQPTFPLALVVGNEVNGISKSLLRRMDAMIFLPMQGMKESLNVSVAYGIAGYHIMKL